MKKYRLTTRACFIGYIVQAIVNNFVPLLFVTLEGEYNIPLTKITSLITLNFVVQLLCDVLSAGVVDRVGYRTTAIFAHICAAAGMILLPILPGLFSDPFIGILLSVVLYAIGGGLLEVIVSAIVEATPSDNKEKSMSLLHSFYCWGQMGVVLLSTAFFVIFGIKNWRIMSVIWAIVPIFNLFLFAYVPIVTPQADGEKGLSIRQLLSQGRFWLFMLMMMCAGAAELSVSQWASAFAETGLGVSKTLGDLMGPMAFAALMGVSRLLFGKYGHKINLMRFMTLCAALCIASYLCIALVPSATVGLLGCAVCGFSVGIFWPGSLSTSAATIKNGGTAMFALLALAGDIGCSAGPTLAGLVSGAFGDNLRLGILAAAIFPVLMLIGLIFSRKGTDLVEKQ